MAEAVAKLRHYRAAPRKLRMIIDMIRGQEVESALQTLRFNPKASSKDVEKLLMSAVSNWQQHNEGVRMEEAGLYIRRAFVDQGRALKRWRPAPRGMAHMYKKYMSHITLVVDSKAPVEQQKAEKAASEPEPEQQDTQSSQKPAAGDKTEKGEQKEAKKSTDKKKKSSAKSAKSKQSSETKDQKPKKDNKDKKDASN